MKRIIAAILCIATLLSVVAFNHTDTASAAYGRSSYDYSVNIGMHARLNPNVSFAVASADEPVSTTLGENPDIAQLADALFYISNYKIVNDGYYDNLWYQVEFLEGTPPANFADDMWILQNILDNEYNSSNDTLILITPVEPCSICGEYDCDKEHVWCGACREYDCGISHNSPTAPIVPIKDYAPPATPYIPAAPELPEEYNVAVLDAAGQVIDTTVGVALPWGIKTSFSAWSELGDDVTYQWQICYNTANNLWMDIYGETGKGILVSSAMLRYMRDAQDVAYIRCITTVGIDSRISEPIPIQLVSSEYAEPNVPVMMRMMKSSAPGAADEPEAQADAPAEDVFYSVIIEYKFRNGVDAAQVYTLRLKAGEDLVIDRESPAVLGYKPDTSRITETIYNIQQDKTYTVTYYPDKVNFQVVHHLQNEDSNGYTVAAVETKVGYTESYVGAGLELTYPGFENLHYDPELPIAADSSTIVNIYYDRSYYRVIFDLNGGYGVESMFVRYGTNINAASKIPLRTGYTFTGWDHALPATVPANDSAYKAQWTAANTEFTVAFWYENANDTDYTFQGSIQVQGKTNSEVDGNTYAVLNTPTNPQHFDGFDADYAQHFTTLDSDKTDENVVIKADGSTVVNVYFKRNTYLLEYYYYKCIHSHGASCYGDVLTCGKVAHQHSHDECCSWFTSVHIHGYSVCPYKEKNGGPNGSDGEHSHSSSCYTNKLICTHGTGWNCGCINDMSNTGRWYAAYSGYHKYESYIGDIHMQMGTGNGYRLIDVYRGGVATGEGPNTAGSGACGTFASMEGGYTCFYRGSDGSSPFYMTYWLESADGTTGTRTFDGKKFVQSTTFYTKMHNVGYAGDYMIGVPHGFAPYKATFGSEDNRSSATETFTNYLSSSTNSTSPYNNFYYIRETYTLTYFNGSTQVATRTLKFEEPLTSTYDLRGLSMTSPYGNGYKFTGWYLDPDCTVPVTWGSTKMPEGGMALYAKWEPIQHEITVNSNPLAGDFPHGSAPSTKPDENEEVKEGYRFLGWFYMDDNGEEQAYDFAMPVYRDMDLYAKWVSITNASGTITYLLEGTNTPIANELPVSAPVGDSKTYDAKVGADLFEEYQTGYFPLIASHTIEFTMESESHNSFIFYYKKMDSVGYTVRYINKATGAPLLAESYGVADVGRINVPYIYISGFAADAVTKPLILSSDPKLNVVTFYYTEDDKHAPVQVDTYLQNIDNDSYQLSGGGWGYNDGIIGSVQTVEVPVRPGFTYNAAMSTNGVELPAEGLTLKLYYDRNSYPYEFRFLEQGTNTELASPVKGSAKYKDLIHQVAPTLPGYRLTSAGSESISIEEEASQTTAVNNVRTFYYVEDTVTISYHVGQGDSNSGTVSPASETLKAKTGVAVGSYATAASSDYTFAGWYSNYACSYLVSNEPHFVPSKTPEGVWANTDYYAKFEEAKVTLNYQIIGADGCGTLSLSNELVGIKYGLANGSTITPADGYELVGWYDNPECTGTALSTNISYIPPRPFNSNADARWVDGTTFYAKVVEKKATIRYAVIGAGTISSYSDTVSAVTGIANGSTATAEAYSTFKGWYDNADGVGTALSTGTAFVPTKAGSIWENVTYYAKFELNPYVVQFETNGGTPAVLEPIEYHYGAALTLHTATKTDAANNSYKLTWKVKDTVGNWTAGEAVTDGISNKYGNVTLVADWTITAIWLKDTFDISYPDLMALPTLEAIKNIPDVIDAKTLSYGDNIEAAAPNAEKTGYTLSWDKYSIHGYVIYRAKYTPIKYTITFKNYDGTVLQTGEWDYDSIPVYSSESPTKPSTVQNTYTFAGWDPAISMVTGETTYTATYTEAVRKYTIKFVNDDGTELQSSEVEYGQTPVYSGATPTKDATAQYTYEFAGWNEDIVPVTGEATYKATYSSTVNKYLIKFVNEDNTPLYSAEFDYGTMPSYNGQTPAKASTAQYTYSFFGWTPSIVTVTGEATYKAQYTATLNEYTITFVNDDGSELQSGKVAYGQTPAYDGTPTKDATAQYTYEFAGWNEDIVPVTGEATYTATYTETVNKYTITFVDDNGTVLQDATKYEYGTLAEDIATPPNPSKSKDGYTCTFNGWTPAVGKVTADVTYKATYTEAANSYTITYLPGNGATMQENDTKSYTIEDGITLPTPTKTGYTFKGWKVTSAADESNWTAGTEYPANSLTVAAGKFGNVRLTAQWEETPYNITYTTNSIGTLTDITTNPYPYAIENAIDLPVLSADGYTFVGWVPKEDAGNWSSTQTYKGTVNDMHGDVTLVALWKPDLVITATGGADGQTFIYVITGISPSNQGVSLTVAVPKGESVTIKDLPVGEYSITENGIWNWRYESTTKTAKIDVTNTADTKSADFVYGIPQNYKWLNHYKRYRKELVLYV